MISGNFKNYQLTKKGKFMKFPHKYVANPNSSFEGSLTDSTENLELEITPPSQFGGEDKHWSPEYLFVNLKVAQDVNEEDYLNLLHSSEKGCLFSNSLKTKISLHSELKRE